MGKGTGEAQRLPYEPLHKAPNALAQDSNSNWAERMDLKIVSLLLIEVCPFQRAKALMRSIQHILSLTDFCNSFASICLAITQPSSFMQLLF